MRRTLLTLDYFERFREQRTVKILTGLRGTGKSYVLDEWSRRLVKNGVKPDHIVRVNLEAVRERDGLETDSILARIAARMPKSDERVYVLLDDVCECHDAEELVGALYAQSRIDLTVTCSTRRPISRSFRDYLSGQSIYLELLPPSFADVPLPRKFQSFEARLNHVLHFGTLPYLDLYRWTIDIDDVAAVYLQGLWNTILVKDILTRNRLADSRFTEKLLSRIYDHLGENESLRKLAEGATVDGCKSAPNTIESYLAALDESFLVRRLRRFDVFSGEELKTGYRFFLSDLGLGVSRYGDFPGDSSNAIRNLIALELAGRGYKVYGGRYNGSDFDFVTVRNGKYACWQYAPEQVNGVVPTAVLSPLKRIPADTPRHVIVRDRLPRRRVEGIEYMTLRKFLMGADD